MYKYLNVIYGEQGMVIGVQISKTYTQRKFPWTDSRLLSWALQLVHVQFVVHCPQMILSL